MVKTIKKYVCQICKHEYGSFKEAIKCEKQKLPLVYRTGMIFQLRLEPCTYYAIVKNSIRGHVNAVTVFRSVAGRVKLKPGYQWLRANTVCQPPNQNRREFRALVLTLKGNNLKPSVWDGKQAIPLTV